MKNREFKKMLVATMVGTMTMSMAAGCANQSDSKSAKADTSTVNRIKISIYTRSFYTKCSRCE